MKAQILKIALVLAGLLSTPVFADCLDEQRQWQREETEALSLVQQNAQELQGLGFLDAGAGRKLCAGLKMKIQSLRHKAAFYRHCHPDLEGEDAAHKADISRMGAENSISAACQ